MIEIIYNIYINIHTDRAWLFLCVWFDIKLFLPNSFKAPDIHTVSNGYENYFHEQTLVPCKQCIWIKQCLKYRSCKCARFKFKYWFQQWQNANIRYLNIVYIFNRITTRNNRPDYSHFTGDLVFIMPKLSSLNLESIYILSVIVI